MLITINQAVLWCVYIVGYTIKIVEQVSEGQNPWWRPSKSITADSAMASLLICKLYSLIRGVENFVRVEGGGGGAKKKAKNMAGQTGLDLTALVSNI